MYGKVGSYLFGKNSTQTRHKFKPPQTADFATHVALQKVYFSAYVLAYL